MTKADKTTLIFTSIVTLLPIPAGLILWSRLPESMAIHFGLGGEADGYASRAMGVFCLPLVLLAVHWLAAFVIARDPRKQNLSPKVRALTLWLVPVLSVVLCGVVYAVNLGVGVDVKLVVGLALSVMLLVVGNYLPKARQNYTVGIRLPWTLANEENWNRTHRLAGFLWMGAGALMAVLTLCRAHLVWLLLLLALAAAVPIGYSLWLHAKKGL